MSNVYGGLVSSPYNKLDTIGHFSVTHTFDGKTIDGGVEEPATIILTTFPESIGAVSGDGIFFKGSSVTVVATPDSESEYPEFDGWYENDIKVSENVSYTFTVSGARTLVAKFKEATPVPVPGSLCARYVNDDYSLCCQMSDGSYRLLNVESLGVPIGSHDQEHDYTEFLFEPETVPLVPAGPKPSGFDPPIEFIDTYTPGPSSPMETIDCTIIADNWTYEESKEYSSYSVAIVSGGVTLTESTTLLAGDQSPMRVVDRDD